MATQSPFYLAGNTPIYDLGGRSYGGLGGMDIDGDGSGGNIENDPYFQPTTTLKHADGTYVNSRTERGIVVPGRFALAVPGIVIGCKAQVTDVLFGITSPAVVHDIGPDDKFGEATIALADFFGINSNPISGGTHQARFFYRIWTDVPSQANGISYPLQRFAIAA
jgi:hypothetical protein